MLHSAWANEREPTRGTTRLSRIGRGFRRRSTRHAGPRRPEHIDGAGPAAWPWPTFTVNIVGAFLIGYFTTRLLERLPLSSYRRPVLGTGLCGGLTTFSTMQVETLRMIEHGHWVLATAYTSVSIVLGLVAVQVATALVRRARVRS